jgi:predicted RNA polymerase sigma factor
MRFMVFVKGDERYEAGEMPEREELAEMGKFNEELVKAGVIHLLPAVRGDLLSKLGRVGEARDEFERAAALTRNGSERTVLLERAAALVASGAA